jgi:hypothetical protein
MMALPLNEDGDPKVTVADIVAYLLTLPQDAPAWLNHDGWLQDEIKAESVHELIEKRGVFDFNQSWGLCLTN